MYIEYYGLFHSPLGVNIGGSATVWSAVLRRVPVIDTTWLDKVDLHHYLSPNSKPNKHRTRTREPKNTDFKGLNDLELKTIDTFGPMSILKNIAIFLPQSLFKCDSISTNDHVRPSDSLYPNIREVVFLVLPI